MNFQPATIANYSADSKRHVYYYRSAAGSRLRCERVLLLTATVQPPAAAVKRADVQLRVADYQNALRTYIDIIDKSFDGVVFVDNSGASLEAIVSILPSSPSLAFELMSFDGNDHPVSHGKAFGEFRIIEYALEHASLISDQTTVWKSTGRIVCSNLDSLAQSVPAQTDWACDLHNVPFAHTGKWRDRTAMDLRVFACTVAGYHRIVGSARTNRQNRFDAAEMYRLVCAQLQRGSRILPRFPVQPRFVGISGRTGRRYHGRGQQMKDHVRAAMRFVAPKLWL